MSATNLAFTAALWLLSASYLFFIARYQFMTRSEENVSQSVERYKWAITFGAFGIFVLTSLSFLNEFGLINKWDQRELGVLWKGLFLAKIIAAFWAVGNRVGQRMIPASIAFGVMIYVATILDFWKFLKGLIHG